MTSDRRGQSRRELLKRGGTLMAAAIAAGIPSTLLAETLATLDVASAGSIRPMLEGPLKTAAAQTLKLDLHTHAKGADAVAQSIVDGSLRADVFIPVTPGPMLTVMHAGKAETAYPIGTTEMVLVYSPRGRFAPQFEAAAKGNAKWWEILQQPGLRFAHGNPVGDPGGRNAIFTMMLAAKKYSQPDLVTKLFGTTFTPPPEPPGSNNQERLQSGDLDATTSYKIATDWVHLPYLDLPADINLSGQNVHAEHPDVSLTLGDKTFYPEPLVYYAAVLKGAANPQGALAFTQWLQGHEAQAIFRSHKYGSPRSAPTLHA
ncbi:MULTISPECIES: substrate-binding domain-containing protein [Acidobacteriaceae]|uniref:substrate-binding domain-containing protein n=1 Tax=Acidobacteriaceae TaxID=204434 RepID=UPI00131E2582|nr:MULTISPECIES: substrate-binding domain-containing protein [Acidobacteriaceae]MDW5265593.1 substrate-binding domain-containing protein [Edaphobacter sp.]